MKHRLVFTKQRSLSDRRNVRTRVKFKIFFHLDKQRILNIACSGLALLTSTPFWYGRSTRKKGNSQWNIAQKRNPEQKHQRISSEQLNRQQIYFAGQSQRIESETGAQSRAVHQSQAYLKEIHEQARDKEQKAERDDDSCRRNRHFPSTPRRAEATELQREREREDG